ncbi:uncharacterized protein LOC120346631 [Styela clava]|uniref:uncharacterized protein LOC120346631 n=1 Tax=Styela clava TaxID=7725 RepID=UPI00193A1859|nr:uncharacterized protein LOC120346631 [Styela clava]
MHSSIEILLVAVVLTSEVLSLRCPGTIPLQNKCKGKRCIPRVRRTEIDWNSASTRGFTVTWLPEPSAQCYYVELLNSYTIHVLRVIPCHEGTTIEFSNLSPWRIYGVQVSAVSYDCRRGKQGVPARVRTLWAPTTTRATTTRPMPTPEPGKCGRRKFTCASNETECIPARQWCNRQLDCMDGSDERGCPGGCEEIDIDFKNGNYSCTRWGSPGSFCAFDCDKPHISDGREYTWCGRKTGKWTYPVPTCRLQSTKNLIMLEEEATATSLTVKWDAVPGAVRYSFLAVEVTSDKYKNMAVMRIKSVSSEDCCTGTITDLKPDSDFKVVMTAVDGDDVDGIKSFPVFGRTANLEDETEKGKDDDTKGEEEDKEEEKEKVEREKEEKEEDKNDEGYE